jgi:hypothetical protein
MHVLHNRCTPAAQPRESNQAMLEIPDQPAGRPIFRGSEVSVRTRPGTSHLIEGSFMQHRQLMKMHFFERAFRPGRIGRIEG